MSGKYKVGEDAIPHFVTFSVMGWIDVFSREQYTGGTVHGAITSGQLTSSGVVPNSVISYLSTQPAPGSTKPKAYLNWVLLEEQFKFVQDGSSAEQVGNDQEFKVHVKNDLSVTKSGYLYVFVSNETPNIDVYFDNLQITHIRGPILEETHYYPFGLTMAGISSKALQFGGAENRYKYNGKELQSKEFSDNSGLELYDFGARMQDPQLGRWHTVDPLASAFPHMSPYAAFNNNPLRYTDPTGMAPDDWYYWMSSEGKLMKREVKNSTNNVYLMNYDERNPSNDKYVLINKFNPKSKGNNLLMIAFVGDLIKNTGGSSLTKEYGFSPNYPNNEALAYSRSTLGQIFLNTNRKMSSDYYDLLNSISHEVGHLKLKDNTLREHAGVYLYGFKDPSFGQSTDDHRIGTVRSFANYLYNIYDRENNSASIETISPLLDKFKELNTGISISYDFSGPTNRGGLNLYVNGSLVDYKTIDEKTHKE